MTRKMKRKRQSLQRHCLVAAPAQASQKAGLLAALAEGSAQRTQMQQAHPPPSNAQGQDCKRSATMPRGQAVLRREAGLQCAMVEAAAAAAPACHRPGWLWTLAHSHSGGPADLLPSQQRLTRRLLHRHRLLTLRRQRQPVLRPRPHRPRPRVASRRHRPRRHLRWMRPHPHPHRRRRRCH